MLQIVVPAQEQFDSVNNLFITTEKDTVLNLEHSLVSISKWESKWKKPFLKNDDKTMDEWRDYVRCMTITQNVNPKVYDLLTTDNFNEIAQYINDTMSATTFASLPQSGQTSNKKETVTSEIIYFWMISYNIPMECQKWHLNRLLTLIRVFSIKNSPEKKMSNRDRAALNAARRAKTGSRG